MATITEANALMTEVAGQSIATAISTMSATSVGNLSALTTTDKSSLVGAINELKSGLNDVIKHFVPASETVTSSIYGDVTIATGLNLTGKKVYSVDKLAGDMHAVINTIYAGDGLVVLKLFKYSDNSILANESIDISNIMLLIV